MRNLKEFNYRHREEFIVQFLDNEVKFDLRNDYTKNWFLPRYDFGKIHEPLIVKFMCRILRPGDIFFDLGAHIGYFSIIAGALKARTYAFELDDNCIPIIEGNIAFNKLSNISIVNKAISNISGNKIKITSFDKPNTTLSNRFNPKALGHKEVETITISDFCNNENVVPRLIKMDIEGAEFQALEGMVALLEKSNDIFVLMEVHPKQLKGQGINSRDIVDKVKSTGYSVLHFGSHRNIAKTKSRVYNPELPLEENTLFLIKKTHE